MFGVANGRLLCYNTAMKRVLPDRVCPTCGVIFRPKQSKSKFCSSECNYTNRPLKGEYRGCAYCHSLFYARPSHTTKRYCSPQCGARGRWGTKPLTCEWCDKEYYRSPSQIRLRGTRFCSRTCRGLSMRESQMKEDNPAWKGGISPENRRVRNSVAFKEWRESVFARDNWTCHVCGKRSEKGVECVLHPHHILPFASHSDWRFVVPNGITLCSQCHKEVHYEVQG